MHQHCDCFMTKASSKHFHYEQDADVRRRRVEEKLRRKKDEGVEFNGKLHDVYNKKELAGAEKKLAELKAKEEAAGVLPHLLSLCVTCFAQYAL